MSLRGRLNQEEEKQQLPRGGILNCRRRLGGSRGGYGSDRSGDGAVTVLVETADRLSVLKAVGGDAFLALGGAGPSRW